MAEGPTAVLLVQTSQVEDPAARQDPGGSRSSGTVSGLNTPAVQALGVFVELAAVTAASIPVSWSKPDSLRHRTSHTAAHQCVGISQNGPAHLQPSPLTAREMARHSPHDPPEPDSPILHGAEEVHLRIGPDGQVLDTETRAAGHHGMAGLVVGGPLDLPGAQFPRLQSQGAVPTGLPPEPPTLLAIPGRIVHLSMPTRNCTDSPVAPPGRLVAWPTWKSTATRAGRGRRTAPDLNGHDS